MDIVYSAPPAQSKWGVIFATGFTPAGYRIRLMDQLSIDLGANRSFKGRVMNIAEHAGL
jgi:hypothetical protein